MGILIYLSGVIVILLCVAIFVIIPVYAIFFGSRQRPPEPKRKPKTKWWDAKPQMLKQIEELQAHHQELDELKEIETLTGELLQLMPMGKHHGVLYRDLVSVDLYERYDAKRKFGAGKHWGELVKHVFFENLYVSGGLNMKLTYGHVQLRAVGFKFELQFNPDNKEVYVRQTDVPVDPPK